jgi:hypothetical protein
MTQSKTPYDRLVAAFKRAFRQELELSEAQEMLNIAAYDLGRCLASLTVMQPSAEQKELCVALRSALSEAVNAASAVQHSQIRMMIQTLRQTVYGVTAVLEINIRQTQEDAELRADSVGQMILRFLLDGAKRLAKVAALVAAQRTVSVEEAQEDVWRLAHEHLVEVWSADDGDKNPLVRLSIHGRERLKRIDREKK